MQVPLWELPQAGLRPPTALQLLVFFLFYSTFAPNSSASFNQRLY